MDIVHPGLLGLAVCRTLDTYLSRASCRLMAFQVTQVQRKMPGSITIEVNHHGYELHNFKGVEGLIEMGRS
jgi:hypothetical protein